MEILIIFSSIIWTYLIFFHGRKNYINDPFFWTNKIIFEQTVKYEQTEDINQSNKKDQVSVIIPARNEEVTISKTIENVINQNNVNIQVIIIDDQSTDSTVKKANQIFKKFSFTNKTIIKSPNLPDGWSGKVWALKQGFDLVCREKKSRFILLLDADINIEIDLVHNLKKFLIDKKFDMVSLMAKLNCKSLWEKLLIPPFILFFQKLYPFNLVNKEKSKISAAAGGCIFASTEIFKKTNVFYKIKNKVIDDCNTAKVIKKDGSIWLGLSDKLISTREYNTFRSINKMISRCAFEQLNNSLLFLLLSIFGMIIIYLAWPISFLSGMFLTNKIFITSTIIIFLFSSICYIPTLRFYNLNLIFFITFPFSALIYTLMTLASAYNFYFSRGNEWKGRRY